MNWEKELSLSNSNDRWYISKGVYGIYLKEDNYLTWIHVHHAIKGWYVPGFIYEHEELPGQWWACDIDDNDNDELFTNPLDAINYLLEQIISLP